MNLPHNQFGSAKTFDDIAEQFVNRIRNGEHPSILEYKKAFPQFSDDIDELFPTFAELENFDATGDRENNKSSSFSKVPEQLGQYVIKREIGRGGMGIVYEAEHETLRRRVALKVLPTGNSKPEYKKRFIQEARAAGQLHHTNIVPVFEVGESDGVYFYAMQYIHGQDLDNVIQELKQFKVQPGAPEAKTKRLNDVSQATNSLLGNEANHRQANGFATTIPNHDRPPANGSGKEENPSKIPSTGSPQEKLSSEWSRIGKSGDSYFRRVARVGVQVSDALDFAHSHGVLHRDIKPSNLILDTDGVVWITDFGLAKDSTESLTHTGDIVGTLRYMAPERFNGNADVRSEVYSLGLTLYELCTLQHPFDSSDRAQLMKIVTNSSPPPPRKINPDIPRDLETIIAKAIAREPSRRYQSARKLSQDLQRFVSHRPVHARRVTMVERMWRVCRRNPVTSLMGTCIAALLATVAVVSVLSLVRVADLNSKQAKIETETRETSQVQLFYSKLDQAKIRRYSGRLGQRYLAISAIKDATDLLPRLNFAKIDDAPDALRLKLRNEAIASMSLTDLDQIWSHEAEGQKAKFAIDSKHELLAEADIDGRIRITKIKDGELVAELENPAPETEAWSLFFSPDSRYLAARYHKSAASVNNMLTVLWNVKTKTPLLSQKANNGYFFSKDSRHFALVLGKLVKLFDIENGQFTGQIEPRFVGESNSKPRIVAFHADCSEIAISQRSGKIVEFWNIEEEPRYVRQIEINENIYSMDWDSRRNLLAIGSSRGGLYYWRGNFDSEPTFLQLHQNTITNTFIHPDRELVATSAWDSTSRLTDLLSGKEVLLIEKLVHINGGFGNGGNIAYQVDDNSVGIWETAGPIMGVYSGVTKYGWATRFHPVHDHIVCRTSEGKIQFWDTVKNQIIFTLHDVHTRELHYTSDGKFLYTSGDAGLVRWNVNVSMTAGEVSNFELNSRTTIYPEKINKFDLSSTEDVIIVTRGSYCYKINASDGELLAKFGKHKNITRVKITADDKHALTSTWKGKGIGIWDTATGELVRTAYPDRGSITATPHPTKPNEFVTGSFGIRFTKIDGEDVEPIIEPSEGRSSSTVYTRDGQLLAAKCGSFAIVLLDPKTGQSYATIESSGQSRILGFDFSPDGNRIALACFENLQIVDLSKIRSELSKLGLDW